MLSSPVLSSFAGHANILLVGWMSFPYVDKYSSCPAKYSSCFADTSIKVIYKVYTKYTRSEWTHEWPSKLSLPFLLEPAWDESKAEKTFIPHFIHVWLSFLRTAPRAMGRALYVVSFEAMQH